MGAGEAVLSMREGRARVKSVGCDVRGCGLAVWGIEGGEMSRNQAISAMSIC